MTTAPDPDAIPDYLGRLRLDGTFVVLGAGQGIGRQTSHALAQAGARVVTVDREPDLAAAVAAEVDGVAWVGDITQRADLDRLVRELPDPASLRGVVDIVGMAQYSPLLETDDQLYEWHHDIVLRHAWLAMQTFGAVLTGTGGAMTFIASASGITGAPMHAAYGAFKAALMALVRSAAVELGPAGVRVNAVAPGVVLTPRVAAFIGDAGRERNAASAPLRRVALPADIASALLFLSSDLAAYVTGQTLVVDGGVSAKFPYPMPDEFETGG